MTRAPDVAIDIAAFWRDPYPTFEIMRRQAPIAYVPELGSIVLTRRDDVIAAERNVEVFSSHQPDGLMNRLMGLNLMRKDGEAHRVERRMIYPALSPKAVGECWQAAFEDMAERLLEGLAPKGQADLVTDYAMPLSAEALKAITGLTNIRYQEMDAWSQAMIDGIANYGGDPAVEERCRKATAAIDEAIDERLPVVRKESGPQPPERDARSRYAHGQSSRQHQARDQRRPERTAGRDRRCTAWALLTHPDQLAMLRAGVAELDAGVRRICPLAITNRHVAETRRRAGAEIKGVDLEPETRVFLMFSSANRDETHFENPECFDVTRDTIKEHRRSVPAHTSAPAPSASKALVAKVALPRLFERLPDLEIDDRKSPCRLAAGPFAGRSICRYRGSKVKARLLKAMVQSVFRYSRMAFRRSGSSAKSSLP